MSDRPVTLRVVPGAYSVCRLSLDSSLEFPSGPTELFAATRTRDELSVVCIDTRAPEGATVETGWSALAVEGPLDFALTGILAAIASPLAEAHLSIFAVSTYDTDYVLVRSEVLDQVRSTLRRAGCVVA